MKNEYPGKCYACGHPVGPREGVLLGYGRGWRVAHNPCVPKDAKKYDAPNS